MRADIRKIRTVHSGEKPGRAAKWMAPSAGPHDEPGYPPPILSSQSPMMCAAGSFLHFMLAAVWCSGSVRKMSRPLFLGSPPFSFASQHLYPWTDDSVPYRYADTLAGKPRGGERKRKNGLSTRLHRVTLYTVRITTPHGVDVDRGGDLPRPATAVDPVDYTELVSPGHDETGRPVR